MMCNNWTYTTIYVQRTYLQWTLFPRVLVQYSSRLEDREAATTAVD